MCRLNLNTQNPVKRLYIHFPFCIKKCSYCAFYSVPNPCPELIDLFTKKIISEIEKKATLTTELESIYIGGGTPSLLPENILEKIFSAILANFAISKDAEISIECNPESLNRNKVEIIANFANRVSLGIQSFNEKYRKKIGRIGETESIYKAFDLIKNIGLKNLSCDLIYSIPGQSIDEWFWELKNAAKLNPQHISTYSLTYEEGTRLDPKLAEHNPELEADIWLETEKILSICEFRRYEISNYAKKGMECRHNLGIWFGDRFLGLGPSAASFVGEIRYTEKADIFAWLNDSEPDFDIVPPKIRAGEILAMGLRTSQGWDKKKFDTVSPVPLELFSDTLKYLEDAELITETNEKIFCTTRGFLLWNEIAERLLS